MEPYTVCLQLSVTRIYTVRADSVQDAVDRASERAERRDDVCEVIGGSAEVAVQAAA